MCDILGVSAGHRPAGIPTVKGKSPMDTIRDWLAHAARSRAAVSLMESPLTDEELLLLDGWSPTPTALWRLKARGSID